MVDPTPKAESEESVDDTDEEEVVNESGASQSEEELVNSNEVDPVESSVSKTVKQVLSFLTSLLDSEVRLKSLKFFFLSVCLLVCFFYIDSFKFFRWMKQ